MHIKNKSVVVTGGAGFIGSHLVDSLVREKPEKITVLSNFFLGSPNNLKNSFNEMPGLEIKKLDVSHETDVKNFFKKNNVDIVFNLAVIPLLVSLENPKWCMEQNISITTNICEAMRENFFEKLVHFSSSEAYGSALNVPMSESHPLNPETPYAASKAASDHIALSYHRTFDLNISVVRPFNNYGPRQNAGKFAGIIPLMIKKMFENQPVHIFGDGTQTRDFIYVTDTAQGAISVCKNEKTNGHIINLGSGEETSVNKLVSILAKETGYKKTPVKKPARPGDVMRHLADISLAKKLIDFKPETGIEQGLKKTVAWYKKNL